MLFISECKDVHGEAGSSEAEKSHNSTLSHPEDKSCSGVNSLITFLCDSSDDELDSHEVEEDAETRAKKEVTATKFL